MTGDTQQPWKRLGELLTYRRIELDRGRNNRTHFARERGARLRILAAIETAERDNYEPGTIAAVEVIYSLRPGAILRFVNGETGKLDTRDASPALREEAGQPADEPPAPPDRSGPLLHLWQAIDSVLTDDAAEIARQIRSPGGFHPAPGLLQQTEAQIMETGWDVERKATEIARLRAALGGVSRDARRRAQ